MLPQGSIKAIFDRFFEGRIIGITTCKFNENTYCKSSKFHEFRDIWQIRTIKMCKLFSSFRDKLTLKIGP